MCTVIFGLVSKLHLTLKFTPGGSYKGGLIQVVQIRVASIQAYHVLS